MLRWRLAPVNVPRRRLGTTPALCPESLPGSHVQKPRGASHAREDTHAGSRPERHGQAVTPADLSLWLSARVRVLDGGLTGELLRRGVADASRLWGVGALLEAPEAVRSLHGEYAAAGADALTAATFRVAPYALRRHHLEVRASALARHAVTLARQAAATTGALVLASQTSLEDCYRPDLAPDVSVQRREHAATARLLADAEPDGLLLETFSSAQEASVAARAATATGLPVLVSFACGARGVLLSGEDAANAAAAVTLPGVVAVGVNCTAVAHMDAALARLARGTRLPLVAYANNGFSAEDSPWLSAETMDGEGFAQAAESWHRLGARLLGGCCGTGPAHISALARRLARHRLE